MAVVCLAIVLLAGVLLAGDVSAQTVCAVGGPAYGEPYTCANGATFVDTNPEIIGYCECTNNCGEGFERQIDCSCVPLTCFGGAPRTATCLCNCSSVGPCLDQFMTPDPDYTCGCSCPSVSCPGGQIQDDYTCGCSCPSVSCPGTQVQDVDSCGCVCPLVECPEHQTQDPDTCGCVWDMPSEFNWRTAHSCSTPIMDQGACGSCYAFAPAAAATDRVCHIPNGNVLSPQQLLDCRTWIFSPDPCGGGVLDLTLSIDHR